MMRKPNIPKNLYKKIVAVMPIPCVDAVIVSGRRFLLSKRKNQPAKGEWWFIGGRILKGETLEQAVARKVRDEAGIRKAKVKKFITNTETIFKASAQGGSSHTINSIFLVEVPANTPIRPDETLAELAWFSKIDPRWDAYVKKALKQAGFK